MAFDYAVALMYESGFGVPRDASVAEQWLLRASAQGNPVAWNNLGKFYQVEHGDREKARACYDRAKELGLDVAHPYPPPLL